MLDWLLEGDVALQYQVHRDLLGQDRQDLQARMATEGWGKQFLDQRRPEGHWGDRFYQPKWQSTHYTLLDLRHLNLPPNQPQVQSSIQQVLDTGKANDGGIRLGPSTDHHSDVCVNGMFLNYAAYFQRAERDLHSLIDALLGELMPDGGFNCRSTRSGAKHSSLHSTISVLEGLHSYLSAGHTYRIAEVKAAQASAEEFVLLHQLYISDRTGEIIKDEFLRLPFPSRWKYDILRALSYFQLSGHPWDERMAPAVGVLQKKRNRTGTWNLNAPHPGAVHFVMEKAGKPSRWNTLRALRVLKHFGIAG
ncbi:MAG TPA: hypothetical protein DCR93_23570 [Cytophagales bacterium]|nr:hypothetical protein [Cytophagales bacterium]HAP62346.1 hypothetical protein [Cytophagales bacterium]